ncbi:hypothetical protein AAFF_G00440890 [Aldrovandia affinis]|uniref:Uncharacterized protein n=1 Tax=Aldrovandia affinis TaxID=143900 RepID=A0AAD7S779_9TELE|nr:hypothetical protein AAFF_G00440890 [Aldrovandia affinis]
MTPNPHSPLPNPQPRCLATAGGTNDITAEAFINDRTLPGFRNEAQFPTLLKFPRRAYKSGKVHTRNKQTKRRGKREKFWELSVGVCSRVLTEDAGLRVCSSLLSPHCDAAPLWRRQPAHPQDGPEYVDSAAMEESGARAWAGQEKSGGDLAAKLLLLDQLVRLENDVIETKRKRSFNGGNTPLDRLSISNMDLKGKQRKVEVPRRRHTGLGHAPHSLPAGSPPAEDT